MTDDAGGFGERLRVYRVKAGLSQEDLAGRSGVSVRAIGDMERGRTRWPHRDSVRLLADALRLTDLEREGFSALARRPVDGSAAGPDPVTDPCRGRSASGEQDAGFYLGRGDVTAGMPGEVADQPFDETATSGTASRPRKTPLIAGLTAVAVTVAAITALTLPRDSPEPPVCAVQNCVLKDRAGQLAVFNDATAVFRTLVLGHVNQTARCWPFSDCQFDTWYSGDEVFQFVRQDNGGGCLQTDGVHSGVFFATCGSHDAGTYWMTLPGGRPGACTAAFWLVNVGITNNYPVYPYGYAMFLNTNNRIYVHSHLPIRDDDQWCVSPFPG